jgi:hypothetical protein
MGTGRARVGSPRVKKGCGFRLKNFAFCRRQWLYKWCTAMFHVKHFFIGGRKTTLFSPL